MNVTARDEATDTGTYRVVRNDEEQYSIWPTDRDLPLGWHEDGFTGPRQACLDHINEVWTDIRPLSLRQRLAGIATAEQGTA